MSFVLGYQKKEKKNFWLLEKQQGKYVLHLTF